MPTGSSRFQVIKLNWVKLRKYLQNVETYQSQHNVHNSQYCQGFLWLNKIFWIFSDVLEWNLKSSGQLWDTIMKFEKFDADGNADFEDN